MTLGTLKEAAVNPAYAEGVILVTFNEGVTEQQAREAVASLGLTARPYYTESIRMLHVEVPVGEEQRWVVKLNTTRPNLIEGADLNHIHRII